MNVQVYNFLAEEDVNDQTMLFYWFMSKILSTGGLDEVYTLANYDLKVLLRGHSTGEFSVNSIPDYIRKFFEIGFVTKSRQTIKLNKETLRDRRVVQGKVYGKLVDVSITEPKVIAMYLYLLGVFAGSETMFYEDKYFGLGNKDDSKYHQLSKVLTRHEISSLLNEAQVDTREL